MNQKIAAKEYNQRAKVYDRRWSGYLAKTLSFVQSWAHPSPSETILDVACGTGELEKLLLQQNPQQKITGVDISEEMLKTAKQKLSAYPQVAWQTAEASDLPFDNCSFDLVVCASSLHYFKDPIASLAEMKRVIKSDGRVIILDWSKDYWVWQVIDLALKVFDSAHHKTYTQKQFHHLLKQVGFKIKRATQFRYGILWQFMIAEAVLTPKK